MSSEKRRRLRISLRVAMLVVLVSGIWLGDRVNKANQQRAVVAAVSQFGGTVHYDYELVNGFPKKGMKPWAPKWIRRVFGDECFMNVAYVQVGIQAWPGRPAPRQSPQGCEKVLRILQQAPGVHTLILNDGLATDEGLRTIGRFPDLERLDINSSELLTDAGITQLQSLATLKHLTIDDSRVTDKSLEQVARLSRLETLKLYAYGYTDAGLLHLRRISNIKRLSIGVRRNDSGPPLTTFRAPDPLMFAGTGVTENGLKALKGTATYSKIKAAVYVDHEGKPFKGRTLWNVDGFDPY